MMASETSPWPIKRVRFVTRLDSTEAHKRALSEASEVVFLPMEAIGEEGQLDYSDIRDIDEVRTGYTRFFEGDVVIAKITPCFENGKGAVVTGIPGGVGFGTTELHVLTPAPEIDGRFLYYVTASEPFRKQGEAEMTGSAGQKRVPEHFVRDFRMSIPPLAIQRATARYLDRECERIDALIAAKLHLLCIVVEKQRSIVAQAVTRGIGTTASLRDSKVPWLGKIPSDWQTRKLAWLFRERDERGEPQLPLLEVSINAGVALREFSEDRIESTAADFNTYKVARQGDIVFNKMRMWQGAVGVAPQDGLVSPDYVVACPTADLSSSYAGLLFRIEAFSAECARHSHGIVWDRLRLYWEEFREIEVPLPPPETQSEIVDYVASEVRKLEAVRLAAERTMALLKERRTALISGAVTGKIDVGGGQ